MRPLDLAALPSAPKTRLALLAATLSAIWLAPLLVALLVPVTGCQRGYDLAILGGRVIDPASGTDAVLNVAVRSGEIVALTPDPLTAERTIDATGLVVAPGFIDVLTFRPAAETIERYKAREGVTSIVFGHDGVVDVPLYFEYQARGPHRVNFGTLVRAYRPDRINSEWEQKRLAENLLAGGLGLASTPEYNGESHRELLDIAQTAAAFGVPYFLHLRHSAPDREVAGVEEALALARATGASIHIMHVHSTGATYHAEEALAAIAAARSEGFDVTADVYPYTYWMTDFRSARFDDFQGKYGLTYGDLTIAGTGERLTEEEFHRRRHERIYVAVPEGTIPEQALVRALTEPWVFIASDGQVESAGAVNMHPRGAGTFPEAFEVGRRLGLTLSEVIAKVSTGPARRFAAVSPDFARRGSLAPGSAADITIFDSDRIAHHGTITDPATPPEGIAWVIVNGEIVIEDGEVLEVFPGRPLKSATLQVPP